MSTPVIQYPLDLTGTSPNNLIIGELHTVAMAPNRAICPNHGPFYTKGLKVRALPSNQLLTKGVHYKAAQMFPHATQRTGQEICTMVIITDPTISDNTFSLDYQVLGGDYSASVIAIQQLIDTLQLDNRAVEWGAILGKPELFPGAPHLHDIGDLYGFEYIVVQLEGIRQAILTGDAASHGEIYQYIDHQDAEIRTTVQNNAATMNAHIADRNNPHGTTKTHVGLSLVQNYGIATTAEAVAGASNSTYMTPLRTKEAIATQAGDLIQQHVNDKNNPHNTTKAQVGLGSVENYGVSTQAQAETGTANNVYMTPLRTAQAIAIQAVAPLNAHIARIDNPHSVTKAQTGLGSVDNFPTATAAEANSGTATNRFMTPAVTKSAISTQVGNAFNAHVADLNNPHQTTKAQVGLGSVDNYPTATTAEAQAGTAGDRFMTALRTKEAITQQAVTPLNNHINNQNNPHNTTKAHVGLGNVNNFAQVRRGGGTNMGANEILLGWDPAVGIRAQVDNSPMGIIHTTNQPDPNLTAHRTNMNNPHGTNKWHVGLGNVDNFPTASDAEAQAGWANDRFMTPYKTRLAIQAIAASQTQGVMEWWGYWRDPVTGYTRCWGRTPLMTISQVYWCEFRRWFSQIFTVTTGDVCRNLDTSASSDGARMMVETHGSVIRRTLSTRGMAICVNRMSGSNSDYVETSWVVEGLSDGSGAGGGSPGYFVSPPTWYDNNSGSGLENGGYTGYTGYFPVSGGVGVGGVGVGGVGVGGVGGCVAVDMYMDTTRQAYTIEIGDEIDGSTYNPDGIVKRAVRQNAQMLQPCYEMTTVSGIKIVASDSTPMTMQDGGLKMFGPEMEGELVLVDDRGDIRWEAVESMRFVGDRMVVLFNVDDQSYFAGSVGDRRIATHNAIQIK